MNAERYVQERAPQWAELDALLKRGETRAAKLESDELLRLGRLYRRAAADLAVANRHWPQAAGTLHLQQLVSRANGMLYSKSLREETAWQFLSRGMWQRIGSMGRCIGLSAACLLGATLLGVIWAIVDPVTAAGILPAGFHATAHNRGGYYGVSIEGRAGLAFFIFTHNIEVTAASIVGGLTFGVLTATALAYNGLLLGVLGGLEWRVGGLGGFFSLIVPHGLLELSCITVGGAAGFAIARTLIDPGLLTRGEALGAQMPTIGAAILTIMMFLVVAGMTEGVITPWDLPTAWAFAVGLPLAGFFWAMVFIRGRGGRLDPGARLQA